MTRTPPPTTDPDTPIGARPDQQLEADILTLAHRLSAGTYELLVLIGELDARGTWARTGALTCAAWLAAACDIELSTARSQVRVARAMRTHPVLDAAMATGDVSYAKARVLVASLSADNATALVELAAHTPAGRLGAAIAAWSHRHEDPDTIAERQHQARGTSWKTRGDGMVVITAILTPAQAAPVCARVDTKVMATRAPAGASLAQQRADALVAAITDGSGPVDTEIVIHVRGDEPATLSDGTPIADHHVARLLPDAFVSLLLTDNHRHPIDASPRRRYPTRRQRRVLDERHPTCQHPGCTATAFLQYDHIQPYAQDGPTILANLRRLCGPHNRSRDPAGGPPTRAQADQTPSSL